VKTLLAGILVLVLPTATLPAAAADSIRPGKWEYTVTTQMPGGAQLPPGVQLPANVQLPAGGAGGMSATHTSCVTSGDPAAELSKPYGPAAAQSRCSVERMNRGAGTLTWATSCTTPDGTSRSEGAARFNADRIEADTKTRTTRQNGAALEVTNHIVGRYLGPCNGR
jgi:hypothetical protein